MSKKRYKRKKIKDTSSIIEKQKITEDSGILKNINPPTEKPSISLKYFNQNFCSFCDFSKKDKKIIKGFDGFIKTINSLKKWSDLPRGRIPRTIKTGEEGQKRLKELGLNIEQTPLIHYKLTDVARVHGVLIKHRFKLIFLDPNHELDK